MNDKLTLVVMAYKESKTLDECVESLVNQKKKCNIIVTTSTPNDLIKSVAKKYKVKYRVNPIRDEYEDVLFAYKQCKTDFVTLCHQDDIYLPNYTENIIKKIEKNNSALIIFSDYQEYKNGKIIKNSKLLFTKRIMNMVFNFKLLNNLKFVKKFVISLGNPICSPTVAFNKTKLKVPIIKDNCVTSWDWNTWMHLSKIDGAFVYISKPLLLKRIHSESETSLAISNNTRKNTDYEFFCRNWPKPIAKILSKIYAMSEKSNKL